MKTCLITFSAILALVLFFSPSDGTVSETDEVKVADPSASMNRQGMRQALQEANLEEMGFNRSTEYSVTTDENGQKYKKNILRYTVKDKCSEAKNWQEKLESRLPSKFFSSSASRTFARTVYDRVSAHPTKYCLIGLEVVSKTPLAEGIRRKRGVLWPRVRNTLRVRIPRKTKKSTNSLHDFQA